MLLRRFADSDERLFHYTRHRPEVCQVHISSAFFRNHLYAMPPVDGERDVTLERQFAELESIVAPLLDELQAPILTGQYPKLNQNAREALCLFFYQQWRRVPDFHDEIMGMDGCVAAIRDAISQFEVDYRPLSPAERETLLNAEATRHFRQRARVNSLGSASKRTVDVLFDKGLVFGLAPPRKSFIIASHPVLKVIPWGASNELNDPKVEAWLPIHPKIVMAFAGTRDRQAVVQLPDREIRLYNLAVARRSTEFASTSRELLESIRRHCPR